jgi:hypothetical protein
MENTLGTWGQGEGKHIGNLNRKHIIRILVEVAGFEHPTSLTRDTGHEP